MRTLSIRQPWAWLIVNGFKPIENRDWQTAYRGAFLVHASQTLTIKEFTRLQAQLDDEFQIQIPPMSALDRGGIVGIADLVDCCDAQEMLDLGASHQRWFTGAFGFVLARARPLPFHPCKGQLGWFDVKGVSS